MEMRVLNSLIGKALTAAKTDPGFRAVVEALNHAKRLAKAGYPAHYVRLAVMRAVWIAEA